jgi:hypothetical protein
MNEDQIKAYELGRLINTFGIWYKTNLFKSINDLNNFAKTLLENTFGLVINEENLGRVIAAASVAGQAGPGEPSQIIQPLFEEAIENPQDYSDVISAFSAGMSGASLDEVETQPVPDALVTGFVDEETREERIARQEERRVFKPLSIQEQQSEYIEQAIAEGDFSDEQLNFVQTMLPSDLPYIGLGGTITPTQPDKLPLYVEGMQYGLFNGMSPEELINVQIALVEADYLYPGSFESGVLDSRTIAAIGKAMEVQNLQGRTNPVLASGQSVQLALSGAGPGIAKDIRNFFISEVKKDEPGTGEAIAIDESIQLFPEFAAIYGETSAEQILGRKIRPAERAMIGSYYSQSVEEASKEVQELLKARAEARKESQLTTLETEQIRLKAGLPEGVYSVEAPPQFTAAPGDISQPAQIQSLITTLAGQRFEDKLTSIGAYAAELEEGDREAEMKSRSRAFTTALNSTGSGALGA